MFEKSPFILSLILVAPWAPQARVDTANCMLPPQVGTQAAALCLGTLMLIASQRIVGPSGRQGLGLLKGSLSSSWPREADAHTTVALAASVISSPATVVSVLSKGSFSKHAQRQHGPLTLPLTVLDVSIHPVHTVADTWRPSFGGTAGRNKLRSWFFICKLHWAREEGGEHVPPLFPLKGQQASLLPVFLCLPV